MQTKKCGKCQVEKPLDEFHRNSTRRDGYGTQCKQCRTLYKKAYRQAEREFKAMKEEKVMSSVELDYWFTEGKNLRIKELHDDALSDLGLVVAPVAPVMDMNAKRIAKASEAAAKKERERKLREVTMSGKRFGLKGERLEEYVKLVMEGENEGM